MKKKNYVRKPWAFEEETLDTVRSLAQALIDCTLSIREIEEVLDAYRVDDHAKGPLYSKMHEVYTTFQIIMGRNAGYMEIMEQRDDPDFHIYKYAPMNSAECERVFSAINDILSDKRMSFENDMREKDIPVEWLLL